MEQKDKIGEEENISKSGNEQTVDTPNADDTTAANVPKVDYPEGYPLPDTYRIERQFGKPTNMTEAILMKLLRQSEKRTKWLKYAVNMLLIITLAAVLVIVRVILSYFG